MKRERLLFDPKRFPAPVVRLILAKAESANCSPSEAMRLLLSEVAREAGFETEAVVATSSGQEAA